MCLHHLLNKRYVEGSITDGNMQDLIAAAIRYIYMLLSFFLLISHLKTCRVLGFVQ